MRLKYQRPGVKTFKPCKKKKCLNPRCQCKNLAREKERIAENKEAMRRLF